MLMLLPLPPPPSSSSSTISPSFHSLQDLTKATTPSSIPFLLLDGTTTVIMMMVVVVVVVVVVVFITPILMRSMPLLRGRISIMMATRLV